MTRIYLIGTAIAAENYAFWEDLNFPETFPPNIWSLFFAKNLYSFTHWVDVVEEYEITENVEDIEEFFCKYFHIYTLEAEDDLEMLIEDGLLDNVGYMRID